MSSYAPNDDDDPFPIGDDLACDRCGRQLCDGSCPTRDPRPVSYDPLPFRPVLTDSDSNDDEDAAAAWRKAAAPAHSFRKLPSLAGPTPKQLPFETRYFTKPRLVSSASAADHRNGVTFFRTPPATPSDEVDLELGTRGIVIPDSHSISEEARPTRPKQPPQQRRRRRRRGGRRTQSDSAATMRTAAAHWSAARDPESVWYADPLAAERRLQLHSTNANGALRSSTCRAVQCFLVMSAAMSVIILIAIGATMILTTSIG